MGAACRLRSVSARRLWSPAAMPTGIWILEPSFWRGPGWLRGEQSLLSWRPPRGTRRGVGMGKTRAEPHVELGARGLRRREGSTEGGARDPARGTSRRPSEAGGGPTVRCRGTQGTPARRPGGPLRSCTAAGSGMGVLLPWVLPSRVSVETANARTPILCLKIKYRTRGWTLEIPL